MVSCKNPCRGETIPPGITPTAGMTRILTPGLTNQIRRMVGCPSIDVDVAEFAVKPSILEVAVTNDPVSMFVCGPKAIAGLEVVVGAVVVGPAVVDDKTSKGTPSSFRPNRFAGYTEFVML
jgi:hypothetical protein